MYYTVYKVEQVTFIRLSICAILALFRIRVPLQLYTLCISLTFVNYAEKLRSL